jgi:DNA-binding transcriptional LysR family regulator
MAKLRYADAVTIDQLELFAEVVDAGSFTRAATRLGRAQSAVSYGVGRLEELLGVKLLERSLQGASVTRQGQILLAETREVLSRMDHLRAAGRAFGQKVEPEVSISVSPIFALERLSAVAREMRERFPHTQLRVHGGGLGANVQDVASATTTLGITGLPELPSTFAVVPCGVATMVKVVGVTHALAARRGPVPDAELKKHLQLVGADTTELTKNFRLNVLSPRTWRIADTMVRYQMTLEGVGWTHFARAWVAADISSGRLVELRSEKNAPAPTIALKAFYRIAAPPGPAGRWLLERLCDTPEAAAAPRRPRRNRPRQGR